MSRSNQAVLATVLFLICLMGISKEVRGLVCGLSGFLVIGFVIWLLGGRPGKFFGGG